MSISVEQLIDASLRQHLIETEALAKLRIDARRNRADILDVIAAHYRLPMSAFYQAAAELRGLSFINPIHLAPPSSLLKRVPQALARRKLVLPIAENDDWVQVATADPDDRATLDALQRLLNKPVQAVVAEPDSLNAALNRYLPTSPQGGTATSVLGETDLIAMLDGILKEAYLRRASDIHLAQEESGLRVRLRVDGKLQDYHTDADGAVANGLISRVKVLANLDIAEQREPQDGGMSYRLAAPIDTEFNIRVATAPTRLGERVTMRLLGQEAQSLTLPLLGMAEQDMRNFRRAIRKPFGMILLTGPTGSGKSTTLFAALQEINNPELNIMTVENPIEYVMDGISQIQTGPKVTFAGALRSLLRHDPDVLMVGEIRDEETADVALKAAMTGHLVFSTLHTNTAVGTISRLVDIGCEPYLIGSTMNAVIAQRLVRRLCPHCRKPRIANTDEAAQLGQEGQQVTVYEPVGCAACQGKGYRGRLGLYETLWFDESLSRLVSKATSEEELEAHAIASGSLNAMWNDGCIKVLAGVTSLSELQTVAVKRH
jgi:type II secretory ATPase GspE/PulE/Tfp pilus assembly ATPase PilB-like protein